MSEIELLAHFSGHVQGVGFRWRTERLLRETGIAGYVRNLTDGRVELCVQGDRAACEDAVARVRDALADNISDVSVEERAPDAPLGPFRIR